MSNLTKYTQEVASKAEIRGVFFVRPVCRKPSYVDPWACYGGRPYSDDNHKHFTMKGRFLKVKLNAESTNQKATFNHKIAKFKDSQQGE